MHDLFIDLKQLLFCHLELRKKIIFLNTSAISEYFPLDKLVYKALKKESKTEVLTPPLLFIL